MTRFFISLVLILMSVSVEAALGDRIDSIEKDRSQLKATRRAAVTRDASSSSYSVQELDLDGTAVREFVTSDGVIFAIAWQGLARPDLSQLLGTYYSAYQSAQASAPRSQRQLVVRSNNLVVRHGGHMRDVRGQAVLSNLVPAGVTAEDLQ